MTLLPFDPLNINNLGLSIERALMDVEPQPLAGPLFAPRARRFKGAGVYAIYYCGDFPLYASASALNQDGNFAQPIYVGMAVPEGGRKGLDVREQQDTTKMAERLSQHAASIRAAQNLDLGDFYARWLPVEWVFISLGERRVITQTRPVWNTVVDGFGSKAAGKGRYAGQRSRWDTLHPGRGHAAKLQDRVEPLSKIEDAVRLALTASSEEELEALLGDDLENADF